MMKDVIGMVAVFYLALLLFVLGYLWRYRPMGRI